MFANRRSAGRPPSSRPQQLGEEEPVVLALRSGGVPVGFEIAEGLNAPLDIVLVRKIGVPWQPELALGAVVNGADPQTIINRNPAAELAIDEDYITSETARQLQEIERRRKVYLGNRPPVPLAGRTVIVVDDGIATGSTARTALRAIRNAGAGKIVLAVPGAPKDALDELQTEVDEIICLSTPSPFFRRWSPLRGIWATRRCGCDLAVKGASRGNGPGGKSLRRMSVDTAKRPRSHQLLLSLQ